MNSVADLVGPERLADVATMSNLRLGKEIERSGAIEFSAFGPLEVVARVRSGTTRTVVLRSDGKTLTWKCTCTSKNKRLCKHGVAVGIATWKKAP
jgi:uncharacterized Zn finger protein